VKVEEKQSAKTMDEAIQELLAGSEYTGFKGYLRDHGSITKLQIRNGLEVFSPFARHLSGSEKERWVNAAAEKIEEALMKEDFGPDVVVGRAPEPPITPKPTAHAMQQGDRVKGYRKMTEGELALFNEGKTLAATVGEYVKKLEGHTATWGQDAQMAQDDVRPCDPRWVAIGKTDLQRGFMALLRGIAQPEGF
jgi:hypothetical protein